MSEIIKDHASNIKQIIQLAKADLIKTYRGAALGWFWAIIKPVITIAVFYFAFSIGLRSGKPITNDHGVTFAYFLWLIAGFIPWFYMSDMISQGTACVNRYSYLVTCPHARR